MVMGVIQYAWKLGMLDSMLIEVRVGTIARIEVEEGEVHVKKGK